MKLVIGMAVGGYGYDSTARRSEQTTAIGDDLAQAGISLDAGTVRKWLREAADFCRRGETTNVSPAARTAAGNGG